VLTSSVARPKPVPPAAQQVDCWRSILLILEQALREFAKGCVI